MEYYKNLGLESIMYFCEFDLIWNIEEWKDVKGYEGIYKISDLGRVKSLSRIIYVNGKYPTQSKCRILKGGLSNNGYRNVYLSLNKRPKTYLIHQLIGVSFLNHTVNGHDIVMNHKNFIRTDNRKLNLEIVTQRENSNQKHFKSTSQYVGVSWSDRHKKWRADITYGRTHKYLGYHYSELDAHNAYQKKLAEINKK